MLSALLISLLTLTFKMVRTTNASIKLPIKFCIGTQYMMSLLTILYARRKIKSDTKYVASMLLLSTVQRAQVNTAEHELELRSGEQ